MKTKSPLLKSIVLIALIASGPFAPAKELPKKPLVQIAILLDTSNIMDGLI